MNTLNEATIDMLTQLSHCDLLILIILHASHETIYVAWGEGLDIMDHGAGHVLQYGNNKC